MLKIKKKNRGFTLIELLIVVAIIAILAVITFAMLNPLLRFQDTRKSVRWQTVSEISTAISLFQVDNNGYHTSDIGSMTAERTYMITDGAFATGCDDQNAHCNTDVYGDSYCLDLSDLVDGSYLPEIASSPTGDYNWRGDSQLTGYTIYKDANGAIWIKACETEGGDEVYMAK